ncbi:MAG: hypothetical protein AAF480_15970 [Actinomycetota bacterium]
MRRLAVLVVLAVVVAACGGDDDDAVVASAGIDEVEVGVDEPAPSRLPLAPVPLSPSVRQIDDVATDAGPIDPGDCATPVAVTDLIPPSELDDDTLWVLLDEMLEAQPEAVRVDAAFPDIRVRQVVAERGAVLAVEWPGTAPCADVLAAVDDPGRIVWVGPLSYGSVWGRDDLPLWRWMLERVLEAAADGPTGVWQSIGTGADDITSLALRAGEQQLAEAIVARFGPLVTVTVGGAPFPPDGTTFDFCAPVASPSSPPGVDAFEIRVVDRGWGLEVMARVTNATSSTVHIGIDRIAVLTERDGARAVTGFNGAMTAEQRGTRPVAPGDSVEISATLGVDPCAFDGTSYSLPPGSYDVVLAVRLHDAESWEDEPSDEVLVVRGAYEVD